MAKMESASDPLQRQNELDGLKARSVEIENEMSILLQDTNGNGNYRNDIIWLAQDLNRIQKKIKELESAAQVAH